MVCAALESLRAVKPGQGKTTQSSETKSGVPLFSGEAVDFDEYCFRVEVKALQRSKLPDPKNKVPLGPDLVEGLSGPGLRTARDLGLPELEKADGWKKLLEAIKLQIMPLARVEARQVYQEGLNPKSELLSRGSGEAMSDFVARRSRWYSTLQGLDKTITIS